MLMSPSPQDWLPGTHLARLIVETVERLDLRAIEDAYAGRGERAYRLGRGVPTSPSAGIRPGEKAEIQPIRRASAHETRFSKHALLRQSAR